MSTLPTPRSSTLERLLALLALAYSLLLTLDLWSAISSYQEMWPFPALYLLEAVLLPGLAALLAFLSVTYRSVAYIGLAGALLAFSILGAWSIGLWYLPVVLLLLATTLLSRRASHAKIGFLVGFFLLSAAIQVAIMLAVINIVL